jgi:hypothetical protein
MNPELLAKLQDVYETINNKRNEESKVKAAIKKEKQAKLYGNSGVTVYHTESGKLGAVIPTGMTSNKFATVCTKCAEKIEEFKNDTDKKMLNL